MVASQQAMVLIHMQTGSSAEAKLDVWSWRTASALSTQCSNRKMNLLFAVVTRQLAPLSDVDMSSSDPRVEMYRRFEDMSLEASGRSKVARLVPPLVTPQRSASSVESTLQPTLQLVFSTTGRAVAVSDRSPPALAR